MAIHCTKTIIKAAHKSSTIKAALLLRAAFIEM
jgi:hypothetical protein